MRRVFRTFVITLLLYVAVYVVNSCCGYYYWSPSGLTRKAFGHPTHISMPDRQVWKPLVGTFERYTTVEGRESFRGNALGYVFAPLILLDQAWVHPTSDFLLSPDGRPMNFRYVE